MTIDRRLKIAMLVLCALGLGVAGYVTYVHYAHASPACTSSGCETVQTSAYSMLAGVPVALLGLIGYTVIGALLLAPSRETTRLLLAAITLGGFAFSAYLTYREVFTIHAICEWCVSSAVLMTLLTGLALTRFLRAGDPVVPIADDEPPRPHATPAAS